MLDDQNFTNISIQLSASDFVSSSEKLIRQLGCDSYEATISSNTIGIQLQIIQYIFRIKTLSKDTSSSPSFQRRDWF